MVALEKWARAAATMASAATTAATLPGIVRWAEHHRLVSRPGPLNPEPAPKALAGGPAILLATVPLALRSPSPTLLALPAAFVVGLVDDISGLTPVEQALAWASCGAFLGAAADQRRSQVPVGAALTLATCVGTNFLDGIDGLAAAVTLASCAGLFIVLPESRALVASLAAATSPFLIWNWAPARCYLGNSGSSLLGVWLSAGLLAPKGKTGHDELLGLACLAVPLGETLVTAIRRLRCGTGLLNRERGHGYDRLVARGVGVGQVSFAYGCLQLCGSALAVAALRTRLPPGLAGIAVTLLVVAGALGSGAFGRRPQPNVA